MNAVGTSDRGRWAYHEYPEARRLESVPVAVQSSTKLQVELDNAEKLYNNQ